jgi:hypothetical protein
MRLQHRRAHDRCRQQMPGFMVPQRVEWLEELPRNPNGKFDRPALAARYRDAFRIPVTLDAFSQHCAHPYSAHATATADRRPARDATRERGGPHAPLLLRPLGHEPQGGRVPAAMPDGVELHYAIKANPCPRSSSTLRLRRRSRRSICTRARSGALDRRPVTDVSFAGPARPSRSSNVRSLPAS